MTAVDLDKLEALAKAATAGPWRTDGRCIDQLTDSAGQGFPLDVYPDSVEVVRAGDDGGIPRDADASFIAAAHPEAVLELVAEVRRLRAEVAAMRAVVDMIIREAIAEVTALRAEIAAAKGRVSSLKMALRNCLALARKKLNYPQHRGTWNDVIRFCREAGVEVDILRAYDAAKGGGS
jgi:hypothetical protein